MFCGQCGKANVDEVRFCVHCGTDLKRQTPHAAIGDTLDSAVTRPLGNLTAGQVLAGHRCGGRGGPCHTAHEKTLLATDKEQAS